MDQLDRLLRFVLGPPGPARLPARVDKAIRQQERDGEILIGWAQIGAIIFFGAFYAVTPKAFPPDAPFEPVPITLSVYLLFTAFRLLLAYRRELPAWFLGLSIIVDVAVLMITIWSFHLQYNQPPALYLKAPTLLYIFIIIALRSLRFDPRWIVFVGAASCAGWIALVLYAVRGGDMMSMITHSYVEYMTSLKILIGAEIDKLVSISAFTAVLALAMTRARRMLVLSVSEQTAAAELSRFFAADIARTIVEAEDAIKPGEGLIRSAAAMFVDLRGFTRLASALGPRDLVQLLGEYQSLVARIVHEHNGSITTYLGDGIMITFGATRESKIYAAEALAASDAILAALAAWQDTRLAAGQPAPGIGIGICTGQVVYGAIGDETRLEYAVIGEPVNHAAKIQTHTKAAQVRALTTRGSYALAQSQGYIPAGAPASLSVSHVPGIAETQDLVILG